MDDPFPSSLPGYESPRIYNSNETQTMEDITGDYYDPSGHLFEDQTLSDPAFSPAPLKNTENPANPSQLAGPNWSISPQSSSSSDSSNQHKRTNSSESSAMGDFGMADTPMANGILIRADPANAVDANSTEYEASNKFMESNFFDFASAASSPTPISSDAGASIRGPQSSGMKMPLRSLPMVGPSNSYNSISSGSSVSEYLFTLNLSLL